MERDLKEGKLFGGLQRILCTGVMYLKEVAGEFPFTGGHLAFAGGGCTYWLISLSGHHVFWRSLSRLLSL